jgi:hypothetical protein
VSDKRESVLKQMNARRVELIHKSLVQGCSSKEKEELDMLQKELEQRLDDWDQMLLDKLAEIERERRNDCEEE